MVTPATFRTLTNEPVAVGLFDEAGAPIHHISLAKEADLFLIAPATANVINKMAYGLADDLLTTTALACTAPVLVAPAMNTAMWRNPRTAEALDILRKDGIQIVEPATGLLACGDEGEGKLASVEDICAAVLERLEDQGRLAGRKLLVTAGPTREYIDPVRYLSNPSSGKTGFAVAEAALAMGAQVTLVAGPVQLTCSEAIERVDVTSAAQMYEACARAFDTVDAAVFTAAVADYTPAQASDQKLKKTHSGVPVDLHLQPTTDILATLGARKGHRYLVGFAAETQDVLAQAQTKLASKHADLVVANDVSGQRGFGTDTNQTWLVSATATEELPELPKRQLAARICARIAKELA
jgi:phosphopantothenoylcysteine decarboxylase/phosphopantothenate--cysteine ligase